jgi:hypothetical protein
MSTSKEKHMYSLLEELNLLTNIDYEFDLQLNTAFTNFGKLRLAIKEQGITTYLSKPEMIKFLVNLIEVLKYQQQQT